MPKVEQRLSCFVLMMSQSAPSACKKHKRDWMQMRYDLLVIGKPIHSRLQSIENFLLV